MKRWMDPFILEGDRGRGRAKAQGKGVENDITLWSPRPDSRERGRDSHPSIDASDRSTLAFLFSTPCLVLPSSSSLLLLRGTSSSTHPTSTLIAWGQSIATSAHGDCLSPVPVSSHLVPVSLPSPTLRESDHRAFEL